MEKIVLQEHLLVDHVIDTGLKSLSKRNVISEVLEKKCTVNLMVDEMKKKYQIPHFS